MKRKKIKTGFTEYFNFSARERRGAFLLTFLLTVQIIFLICIRNHQFKFTKPDQKLVNLLLADTIEEEGNFPVAELKSKIIKPEYFLFNPNEIDSGDWVRLGLSSYQARVISNYVSKGGKFRIKKDLKKMYCIDEKKYSELEQYIALPDSQPVKTFPKNNFKSNEHKNFVIDLSKADSVELMNLRGIGPVFASRIAKYRERLGGFYSIDQLKEVYGITDSLFEVLSPKIILSDSVPFRFIHLNSDSFPVLSSHPYLKKQLASIIISYRRQHHGFSTIEELKNIPLIEDENFRKLAPYLHPD